MKRRVVEKTVTRPAAPSWCTSLGHGVEYAAELTGSRDLSVWMPALRQARWQWCQENGCYRVGKTCEEVSGHRCTRQESAE